MQNRKKSLMAVLWLLISTTGYSQKLTLDWGPETEEIKHTHVVSILGKANDKYYIYREKDNGKSQFLEVFDKGNKIITSNEILMPNTDGKTVTFEDMKLLAGQPVLFYSFYNKKLEKNLAFGNKLDDNGKVIGEPFLIDEIAAQKKRNAGSFSFILSDDSSKLLVYRNDPYEKHADEAFNIKVLDKELKTIWEKHVTMPVQDEDFQISKATIANDGKVYILAKYQHGNRTKKEGKPTYKYFINVYSQDQKEPVQFELSLGDKFISGIDFKVDKSSNLICAGFYSNKNAEGIAGTFFLKINGASKQVTGKGIKDFGPAFLKNFMSDRKAEKEKELEHFEVKKIIMHKDGSAVVIAEQNWIEVVTNYTMGTNGGMGRTTTSYYYHTNSIIAIKVGISGSIDWMSVVPKKQTIEIGYRFGYTNWWLSDLFKRRVESSSNLGIYNRFVAGQYNNKLFFVYNDIPKNLTIEDNRDMKELRIGKAVAVLATIDENGALTRQELFSNKENKVILCPNINLQTNDNEIELYAEKGKYFKFGNIGFE